MKQKIFAICIVFLLTFGLVTGVSAQSYFFNLDQEVVNVFWNEDGTLALDYQFTFTNSPGGHVIDFVDVGVPTGQFSGVSADVNGNPLTISSDFQGQGGSGFSVDMGAYAIQPGQSGSVHVVIGQVENVLYKDDEDDAYASAVFSPNWFGSEFVSGVTNLTVTYHMPPGVQPSEPRWHSAPSGFPSEPQTGIGADGRVFYSWNNPAASGSTQYTFGASFPKSYIPESAIVTAPPFDFAALIGAMMPLLFCGIFAFVFIGMPIIGVIQGKKRKMQYMPPKIAIEGHGIKRGLTAVESAILMEQPLDKVMTMVLFGAIKKNAASVKTRDPLELDVVSAQPEGLHQYETDFLKAFKNPDKKARQKELQDMMIALVKSVSEKMRGFSRKETLEYYKAIMEKAWQQIEAANTPEVKSQKLDEALEWTMLDKDYDDRTRRMGPVFVPMWWGRYNPTYSSRPLSTGSGLPTSMPSQPSGGSSLPGADFAAQMVTGVQTFSSKVLGNVNTFTEKVTGATNPPPKPTSSGRSGSGRSGGGCACACACAGCACACAGGGR
ncbi:MAG: hypothetical protein IPJ46_02730 [Anaerolineales bacterium]|nr:hypothetical protein [Anaerolineales bacterium]